MRRRHPWRPVLPCARGRPVPRPTRQRVSTIQRGKGAPRSRATPSYGEAGGGRSPAMDSTMPWRTAPLRRCTATCIPGAYAPPRARPPLPDLVRVLSTAEPTRRASAGAEAGASSRMRIVCRRCVSWSVTTPARVSMAVTTQHGASSAASAVATSATPPCAAPGAGSARQQHAATAPHARTARRMCISAPVCSPSPAVAARRDTCDDARPGPRSRPACSSREPAR